MAFLPRPVTRMMLSTPDATASSTPYWMIGLSTSGSISLGCALVAGRKRVPRPAAGKTAFRIFFMTAGNAITRVPKAPPGHATLNGHARPQVRGGEPRARPHRTPEPGPDPRADPGLARPAGDRPLDPRRGAAGGHPEGRAAPAPAARRGRGDRPPGPGEAGCLRAEGRDEGCGRRDQGPRGAATGGGGRDPPVPAPGPEPPRPQRARGARRLRQRRGAAGGRAKALRVRAQGPLGPRARAGDPRLRARGQDLG